MADVTEVVEVAAKAAYLASGGDETAFPWPCRGADHYRHLAKAVLIAAEEVKEVYVTNIRCPQCDSEPVISCPACGYGS